MRNSSISAMVSICDATSSDEVWSTTQRYFQDSGFSHCGMLGRALSERPQLHFSGPQWVIDRYVSDWRYKERRTQYAYETKKSFKWGETYQWQWPDNNETETELEDSLKEIDSSSNFAIPYASVNQADFGAVLVMTPMRQREFDLFIADLGQDLQIVAMLAYARMDDLNGFETVMKEKLSSREKEVLLWLSKGMRNENIADKLLISRRTVEFHMANICRKFKASTREQALVLALQRGIITP